MQAKTAYRTTLVGYLGLWPIIIWWYGFAAEFPDAGHAFITAVFLVPLIFPFWGIVIKRRRYTIAWSSMMSVFYFGWGIMELWNNVGIPWPWLATLCGWLWFYGAVSYCRKVATGEPYPN